MSSTAIALIVIAAVVALGLGLAFVIGAVVLMVFMRRKKSAPKKAVSSAGLEPVAAPSKAEPAPEPVAPPAPPPPPPGLATGGIAAGGLLGFFDDEPPTDSEEMAKTEVFTRGQAIEQWDDDGDGEATEIFRADRHPELSDLGFALDDD